MPPTRSRRDLLAALPLSGLVAALARAQGPQPVPTGLRVLVGSAPGGPADLLGRVFAQALAPALGVPAVVENRPGASGTLAAAEAVRGAARGSLLVAGMGSTVAAPHLFRQLPYEPARDLLPVAVLASSPMVLVAPRTLAVDDAQGLQRAAQAHGARGLAYASSGLGSANHLCALALVEALSLPAVHLPFQGDTLAQGALVAGDAQFMFMAPNVALPLVASGRLRALAVSQDRRLPQLPATPTLGEFGLPGLACRAWTIAFAPLASPVAWRERIGKAWAAALAQPGVRQRLEALGLQAPADSGPEAAAALLHEERQRMARLMPGMNIER